MAEIDNYDELTVAFAGQWPARDDIFPVVDHILRLAEGLFNSKLRMRQMEITDTLEPDIDNICTLPDDYIEYKRVVELASIRRPLAYITEDAADRLYPTRAAGLACNFTILGSGLMAFPLSSNDIELTYYQKIPPLSGSNQTNWLLTEHPNVYMHACLMYVGQYVQDTDRVLSESQFLQTYLGLMEAVETRGKFGNASVTLTGCTP